MSKFVFPTFWGVRSIECSVILGPVIRGAQTETSQIIDGIDTVFNDTNATGEVCELTR